MHPDQLIQVTVRISVTRFNSIKSRGLHRLHAGNIGAWRSATMSSQLAHTALDGVRGSDENKGPSAPTSLVARITNAVLSCNHCEYACRMLRGSAVHNTSRRKEAQQQRFLTTDDPGSAVGDRTNVRLSVTSPRQSIAYEGCAAICARGHPSRWVLRRYCYFYSTTDADLSSLESIRFPS